MNNTKQVAADFGNDLRPVPEVGEFAGYLDSDGRYMRAPVVDVGTRIFTRSGGGSNYVWLTVDADLAERA